MLVTNASAATYFLGSAKYRVDPGGAVTVPDSIYNGDDSVARAINSLDTQNLVTVSSAPAGYPRAIGDEVASGSGLPDTSGASQGDELVLDAGLEAGWAAQPTPTAPKKFTSVTFSQSGVIADATGTFKWATPFAGDITEVVIAIGTVADDEIIVDIMNNGVSIWSDPADRPQLAIASPATAPVLTDATVACGVEDLLSVNLDTATNTTGADLTVTIYYTET